MGASAQPVGRDSADLVRRLAGSWEGTGTGAPNLAAGPVLRIACRVAYIPGGAAQLHIALDCASKGYRVQIESDLSQTGDRLAGTLVEREIGVQGNLSGTIGRDRMDLVVSGMGLSASLSVTLHGDAQVVTLRGLGPVAASGASVTLRKS
jgi:hypothetical protein